MTASEALIVEGKDAPAPVPAASGPITASPRRPQLMPVAQLLAVVLGVLAIIWNQQQTTDNLRTELRAEITELRTEVAGVRTELGAEIASLRTELRAEIAGVRSELGEEITGLRTEIASLRTELGEKITGLRAEVAENSQRLARIEGFLGIGIPDDPPQ